MLALWYALLPFNSLRPSSCDDCGDLKDAINALKETQQSLMIKHFPIKNKEVTKLACARTADGMDIYDVIDPGLSLKEIEIGVQIPHIHCLCVFSSLYDPIIREIHQNFGRAAIQPESYYGVPACISNLDPSGNFILFTQFETIRNLDGYNFEKWATKAELVEVESYCKRGINEVLTLLTGKYMAWHEIDNETICFLKNNGIDFDCLIDCNPGGRGFYMNDEKNIIIWINHQHHIKIITIGTGGDLKVPYANLELTERLMERRCVFSKHERFGFVGPSVVTIGTGMTARAFLNLPSIVAKEDEMKAFVADYGFTMRKVFIPNMENIPSCNWKIENRTHLGITEFKTLSNFQFVLTYLIGEEMKLNPNMFFPKVVRTVIPTCEEMHSCDTIEHVSVCQDTPCQGNAETVESMESTSEIEEPEPESSTDTSFTEEEPKLDTKSCVLVSGEKFAACFSEEPSSAENKE